MSLIIRKPLLCRSHRWLCRSQRNLHFIRTASGLSRFQKEGGALYQTNNEKTFISPRISLHTSSLHSSNESNESHFPTSCDVVICGGGVIGASVAYHLALAGWTDVVLLEQGSLACGTTWHAAGIVGMSRSSVSELAICKYSVDLYRHLEQEGYSTGWRQCGSLNLCRTMDRVIAYKRILLRAERFGIESQFLTPSEIQERYPILKSDDLQGGYLLPNDGIASPTDVCMALTKKAKEAGVKVIERCKVQRVLTKNEKVCGVDTDLGSIDCKYFVNTAGQWARDLGYLSDPHVRVPLHSCEHFYIITKPMHGIDQSLPVVRDYDGYIYLREYSGGLLGGGFEPVGKPVFHEGVPDKFEFQLLPEDWDHFQVLLEQLLHRVPGLAQAEVRQMTNGPESFTPDGRYIFGEAPEVDNYFVAAGMNSSGIAAAGGMGKYLAELMTTGESSIDLWNIDIRRFVSLHNNKKFLRDRVKETIADIAQIHYWDKEMVGYMNGRKLRTSPIFSRTELQAVFGQMMGYERPLYFENEASPDEDDQSSVAMSQRQASESSAYDMQRPQTTSKGSFGKPVWFDKVRSEYWACREGVCLIDMSTFSKFELRSAGTEVVDFLQHVCSNDVDRSVGSIIHTGMHNKNGGYENDCSVVRMAENRYFMISPTAQQTRSFKWLKKHLPADGSVQLSDVTSMYTAINVIGPKAKELLAELTDARLGSQDFMHMTCKLINVGQASGIKAMRLTHSGEDGWMLYIPSEYALHVYDCLMEAGKNYGVRNAGYYALRALRTEKFFAYWGTDLTPFVTPLECGREYRVKFDRGGFIGYPALLRQRSEGIKKKLVQFLIEDHDLDEDPWPWGSEPIYRNGKYCGTTTSTAYGFTLDRHICLGYIHDFDDETGEARIINNDFILKNAKFEIDIAGKRFPTKAGIYPPKLASAAIVINPVNPGH